MESLTEGPAGSAETLSSLNIPRESFLRYLIGPRGLWIIGVTACTVLVLSPIYLAATAAMFCLDLAVARFPSILRAKTSVERIRRTAVVTTATNVVIVGSALRLAVDGGVWGIHPAAFLGLAISYAAIGLRDLQMAGELAGARDVLDIIEPLRVYFRDSTDTTTLALDRMAERVEALDTQAKSQRAKGRPRKLGDAETIVGAYYELRAQHGGEPTQDEVAMRLKVDRTTLQRALKYHGLKWPPEDIAA